MRGQKPAHVGGGGSGQTDAAKLIVAGGSEEEQGVERLAGDLEGDRLTTGGVGRQLGALAAQQPAGGRAEKSAPGRLSRSVTSDALVEWRSEAQNIEQPHLETEQ